MFNQSSLKSACREFASALVGGVNNGLDPKTAADEAELILDKWARSEGLAIETVQVAACGGGPGHPAHVEGVLMNFEGGITISYTFESDETIVTH